MTKFVNIRRLLGFTIVELLTAVAIIGVLDRHCYSCLRRTAKKGKNHSCYK